MCVTTLEAQLSKTRIGAWDILHPQYGYRHVLAYQNNAQNLADSPNCMLLHIPGNEPLSAENIINTENDVEILLEMEYDVLGRPRVFASQNQVVEMGVYHLGLLNDFSKESIENTLNQIPENKRPQISQEIIQFYNNVFSGFPLVLCCFNNKDAKDASPVMLHFNPRYPDMFQFNTLDSHGGLPDLNENIKFQQTIITGSYKLNQAGNGFQAFLHEQASEGLKKWLPKFGTALKVEDVLLNRDLLIGVKEIQEGGDAIIDIGFINEN